MARKIVLFGAGEFAEVVRFYFQRQSDYDVIAVTLHGDRITGDTLLGLPTCPFEEVQAAFPPADYGMFVAVGYTQVNRARAAIFAEACVKGYDLVTYIDPRTAYYDTPVGANCFIFENCTLQPFTHIGHNVTMWSGTSVCHHSRVGNHVFMASNVVVSGGVTIGDRCFIGANSTLRDHITIGAESVLGAGSVVMKDVAPKAVYRAVRTRPGVEDSATVRL